MVKEDNVSASFALISAEDSNLLRFCIFAWCPSDSVELVWYSDIVNVLYVQTAVAFMLVHF